MNTIRNYPCLLPDGHIVVRLYAPHPCGGLWMMEAWCWGPRGRVGYYLETHDQERTKVVT